MVSFSFSERLVDSKVSLRVCFVCMCVHTCIPVHVCVGLCVCICVHVCVCWLVGTTACACVSVCVSACGCLWVYVRTCASVCVCACLCVPFCVSVCMCMHMSMWMCVLATGTYRLIGEAPSSSQRPDSSPCSQLPLPLFCLYPSSPSSSTLGSQSPPSLLTCTISTNFFDYFFSFVSFEPRLNVTDHSSRNDSPLRTQVIKFTPL